MFVVLQSSRQWSAFTHEASSRNVDAKEEGVQVLPSMGMERRMMGYPSAYRTGSYRPAAIVRQWTDGIAIE
jgi:hypothetical protein